jgi:hypothetical protein
MKKLILSIPEPCHENWDKMNPVEKGRFCNACQKTVIDFSSMSDRELAEFFKKPQAAVCGKFDQFQLERNIQIPRKRIPWIRYFFQIALPAFLFSMKSQAQGMVHAKTIDTTYHILPSVIPKEEIKPEYQFKSKTVGESLHAIAGGIVVEHRRKKYKTVRPTPVIPPIPIIPPTAVIQKPSDTTRSTFSVYPNPATPGATCMLSFRETEKGSYLLAVINIAGEIVQTKKIIVQGKKDLVELDLNGMPAGAYYIRLTNKKTGKDSKQQLLIQ